MAASTIILPLILTATGIAQAVDAYNHITYGRNGSGPVAFRGNINIIDWDGAGRSEIVSGIGRMYENTGPASQPMWSPHGKNHRTMNRMARRFI